MFVYHLNLHLFPIVNDLFPFILKNFSFFGGGGMEKEEEQIIKGDDVIVELDASLEVLYMGCSVKVWREKNVIKPAPGKRPCKCMNEICQQEIAPGAFFFKLVSRFVNHAQM